MLLQPAQQKVPPGMSYLSFFHSHFYMAFYYPDVTACGPGNFGDAFTAFQFLQPSPTFVRGNCRLLATRHFASLNYAVKCNCLPVIYHYITLDLLQSRIYYFSVSIKNVSTTQQPDANYDNQTTGTPEQGLRILARIIAKKLICGMDLQGENAQVTIGEAKVSVREDTHLIEHQRNIHPCEGDSSNDGSTEKLPYKEK
jgi:hypothetical protein